ncbi:MAG TPA: hypothetical protein VFT81_02065 [Dermatophilaceae bacterium]|nr:hypothetical protein [Dermatophilaceae bacterium]
MSEDPTVNASALVSEAMSKSGIIWVDVPGDRAWPVWHVWVEDTAYVVNGPGEQDLPWLPSEVSLILRSRDTGGRLVMVRALTKVLEPGTPEWQAAAEALRAERLNATDDSLTRWAQSCTITALHPFDAPLEGPGGYAADDRRAQAPDTPATTRAWKPWHWRGRGRSRA